MSESLINIAKTLKTLDADLNAVGWDLDSRIYHLIESADDPIARLAGVMPGYPPTDMLAAYDMGMRCPGDIHGLVVANEGYRHLNFEELTQNTDHPLLARIRAFIEQEGAKLGENEVREILKAHYYDQLMPTLPPPSALPPHMRVELRILTAVLRDGTCVIHTHSRDKDDASTDIFYKEHLVEQNIPKAMYLFLNDVRPDLGCEDPLRAVSDSLTVKALADLPTARED